MKKLSIKKLNELLKRISDNWTPEIDVRIRLDTAKHNQSCAHLGILHYQQTKDKISLALKGRAVKIVTCPHCTKQGGNGAMHRWHFEKCKLNQSAGHADIVGKAKFTAGALKFQHIK